MNKQGIQLVWAILAWFTVSWAHAQSDVEVPWARDLAVEAQASQAKRLPLLVLFTSPGCPYCERVMQEFLLPMQRNPEYRNKVVMRQVDIGSSMQLRDFGGLATTHAQFSAQHKIKLVPTIKLFDASGRELTQPIVGLLTPDFYGGYLDQAIDEALARLRSGVKSAAVVARAAN
jgi:thioredoxin-related protein